jgi:arylsulfatase A
VPFVMAGPGVPNGLYTFPAGAVDLLPTLSAMLSVEDDARLSRDGVSILPFLREAAPNRPRPMAWFFYRNKPQAALRSGDYVLVASFDDSTARTHFIAAEDQEDIRRMPSEFDTFKLYDIRKDPGQTKDLAKSQPETTRMLALELQKILIKDLDEAPIWKKLPSRKGWPQRVQNWPQE